MVNRKMPCILHSLAYAQVQVVHVLCIKNKLILKQLPRKFSDSNTTEYGIQWLKLTIKGLNTVSNQVNTVQQMVQLWWMTNLPAKRLFKSVEPLYDDFEHVNWSNTIVPCIHLHL